MSAPTSTPSRHATCQRISRRNSLPVRSGQDSESSLWLPGKADEDENHPALDPATRRILVVDVAGEEVESLALLLRNWRHQVRVAHDGPAALAAWDGFRPELVLLEADLPGMEGYEVARRLRALPGSEDVLLVAMSALAEEEDRRRCYEAGFDGHMPKPVELNALRQFLAHPKLLRKTTAQG